ncbi:hypothetical protein [Halopseudomonas salina]|nr:hypothetical protein [Halopseudomonas salina]
MKKLIISRSLILLAALMLLGLAYYPGTTGALYYDDYSNLSGLTTLASSGDIQSFVFGGHSGPLGRPLALLSFVPFADGWPRNTQAVLLFNVLIHLLNFLLLVYIGHRLVKLSEAKVVGSSFRVSVAAAFMWAILPILASTSLIAIQRMTGLATLFGLFGVSLFLHGYKFYQNSPNKAMLIQVGGVGAFSVLSVFSKEIGLIFPVYALVIELLFARKVPEAQAFQNIRRLTLLLPLLVILYQISPLSINWFEYSEHRGYTPWDRLLTETYILWQYLFSAFFPQSPTSYGPFHDYFGVLGFELKTILAMCGWAVISILAFKMRKRSVWLLFALAWYLTGHLIESTTVLLELYYEHRNYTALYGAVLSLTVTVFMVRGRVGRIVRYSYAIYCCLLLVILYGLTNLWGQPAKAADVWNQKHPGSVRAALHSVFIEMEGLPNGQAKNLYDANQDFIVKEKHAISLRIMDKTFKACPDCINIRIQALLFACVVETSDQILERFKSLLELVPSGNLDQSVINLLFDLHEFIASQSCGDLDYGHLSGLLDAMIENKAAQVPEYNTKLFFLYAMTEEGRGDISNALTKLDIAEQAGPQVAPVLQYQVYLHLKDGDKKSAYDAVRRREKLLAKPDTNSKLASMIQELKSEIESNDETLRRSSKIENIGGNTGQE